MAPSGLTQWTRVTYGERLGFYRLSTRLPRWVGWLLRPWDTALSAVLLRPVDDPDAASAVLCDRSKPSS